MSEDETIPPTPTATGRSMPPVTQRFSTQVESGTVILRTYEIEKLISKGGMGEVYRGRNIHTGDPVAIKIVLPHLAQEEMIIQLFQKEAKVLGRLGHDAIVRYHMFTNDPDIGRPLLIMEFVEGTSMNDRMKQGPMSAEEVAVLLRRLASGLDKAHSVGVVHRDLSPDNVILEHGVVAEAKIIDFGIAKSSMKGDATLLQGQFAGKFSFVAPEQLGAFGGNVDARTDIYSLALMMVAACQGKVLNMGKSIVEAVRARNGVPDLHMVYPELRPLLEHMLEPDPEHRPASMADVIRLLDNPQDIPPRAAPEDFDADRTVIRPVMPMAEVSAPGRPATQPGTAGRGSGGSGSTGRGSLPVATPKSAPPGQDALFVGIPGTGSSAAPTAAPSKSKGGMIAVFGAVAIGLGLGGAYMGGVFDSDPTPPDPPPGQETPGNDTVAGGNDTVAGGQDTVAGGQDTVAGGNDTVAGGQDTVAGGNDTVAGGQDTVAGGNDTVAGGQDTVAGGNDTVAGGQDTVAGGNDTVAGGTDTPVADDPLAKQRDFITAYNAGPCTFLAITSAQDQPLTLDAYGKDVDPFAKLLQDFTAAHGLEPDVSVKVVRDRQCAVIDYANSLRGTPSIPPRIALDGGTDQLKSGEMLTGRVEGLGGRALSLFLINSSGHALNLIPFLTPESDGSVSFKVALKTTGAEPTPQVLLALVTEQAVAKFAGVPNGVTAQTLVPFIKRELDAQRLEPAVALHFFRLQGL
jgi:serine/threonine-protein kinase